MSDKSETPRTVRLRSGIETVNGITGETAPTYSEYVLLDDYNDLKRDLAEKAREVEEWKLRADFYRNRAECQRERAKKAEAERGSANKYLRLEREAARQNFERAKEAEAEAAALREDAERYRFIRDVDPDAELPTALIHKQNSWGNWNWNHLGGDDLDAAIDAARKGKP